MPNQKNLPIPRRQEILQEYFQLEQQRINFEFKHFRLGQKGYKKDRENYLECGKRQDDLSKEYQAGVPIVPLSRCPFCQTVISHSLDTFGLDGLWWKYNASIRPEYQKNTLCSHYLQLSGAVRLSQPVEKLPTVVSPGPEVPFVLPRLLSNPLVRAVISSTEVGIHQAYPIFYFTESKNEEFELFDMWGTDYYKWVNGNGELTWGEAPELTRHYDFQIEVWIERGKLLWISPGDEALKLNNEVKGCPYLNLAGRQERLYIQDGEIWS